MSKTGWVVIIAGLSAVTYRLLNGSVKDADAECAMLYWFDNDSVAVGHKKFCGDYDYEGLQTFELQADADAAFASRPIPEIIT